MNNVQIYSKKLKDLTVVRLFTRNEDEGELLEIYAPNLQFITLNSVKMDKYAINNSPPLVEAYVFFPNNLMYYKYWSKVVRAFSGVKRLTAQNWWFKVCVLIYYVH